MNKNVKNLNAENVVVGKKFIFDLAANHYVIRDEVKVYLNTHFTSERVATDYAGWFDRVFVEKCQCHYFEFRHKLYDRYTESGEKTNPFKEEVLEVETAVGFPLSKREVFYINSFIMDAIDTFVQKESKIYHGNSIEIQKELVRELKKEKIENIRLRYVLAKVTGQNLSDNAPLH